VAPAAVRSAEFVRALGKVLHRPTIFPLPEFVIRTVMGEMGQELLLTSAHAVPEKLQAAGYRFRHADLEGALRAALQK
jgi:NAD dependent epimerase/dehydratase family enzyme